MTVKELVHVLQTMPQDMEVWVPLVDYPGSIPVESCSLGKTSHDFSEVINGHAKYEEFACVCLE